MSSHHKRLWLCFCGCGNTVVAVGSSLLSGNTRSCGCLKRKSSRTSRRTHGATADSHETPEHRAWAGMIQRCTNPNRKDWKHYGGRGIKVCDRWRHSFSAFLEDMGLRPGPGYSLDRFPENNGNYEPGNCRWATRGQQHNNMRRNLRLEFRGRVQTLSQWAKELGMKRVTIKRRLNDGWTVEEALSIPVQPWNRPAK